MKIFGKTLKEYIWPIKYYILFSILVVVSQYYVALPLSREYPYILNLTQALWALMVALSVIKLTLFYNFNFKNVLFLGVLYSFIIHGLKAFVFRVFLFPYSDPTIGQYILHLLNRFFYGSFLVMVIVIILGPIFIKLKNNQEVRKSYRWL
ncbi:hypothetical protein HZA75_04725 [Candidatus Roizmanbacteria bacterium]|nr:hypothetical protein [Candidatus Roizmanbacteria bacterium]